jgi:hypothetical protein
LPGYGIPEAFPRNTEKESLVVVGKEILLVKPAWD